VPRVQGVLVHMEPYEAPETAGRMLRADDGGADTAGGISDPLR
jgi:hypothetical protein